MQMNIFLLFLIAADKSLFSGEKGHFFFFISPRKHVDTFWKHHCVL